MMSALRVGWVAFRLLLHIVLGTAIIASFFPFASAQTRRNLVRWWSRLLLGVVGVRLEVVGRLDQAARGRMLVLNHISWIDIYAVHAVEPARFVAKSEIRKWPVIGYLCDRTGTIFIERGRRHAVHQAIQHIATILGQADWVGVFPEGTTSDGTGLLPFHANLIQAAIETETPIQPVALRYLTTGGDVALAAAYVGETSLWESLVMVVKGGPIIARMTLLKPIDTRNKTRHQVAAEARSAIALSLGLDTEGRPPAPEPDFQGELL